MKYETDRYTGDKIDFVAKDIDDYKGPEENFLVDGNLVQGKILKKLNARILK